MNPEQARQLRDAINNRSHREQGLVQQYDSIKTRRLHFAALPGEPDAANAASDDSNANANTVARAQPPQETQVELVRQLLDGIDGLTVVTLAPHCLQVTYTLTEFTLAGLEKALISQGFRFQNSWYRRLERSLIHFWEETQLRNMRVPQRLIKKSNEVYVKAWEQHPHGDCDETPLELREQR